MKDGKADVLVLCSTVEELRFLRPRFPSADLRHRDRLIAPEERFTSILLSPDVEVDEGLYRALTRRLTPQGRIIRLVYESSP